jgi:hypothetical protein
MSGSSGGTHSLDLDSAYDRAHKLHQAGKLPDAEAVYRQILTTSPNEPEILRQLAACVAAQGREREALTYARHAVALEPRHAGGRVVLAGVLGHLGEHEACGRELARALEIAPDAPLTRWNHALWLLLEGHWAEGWEEYRWGVVTRDRRLRHLAPEWDGAPLPPHSTLFLWAEQGLGDTIMFCRFAREARARSGAARVVLEAQEPLVALLVDAAAGLGVDEVITQQLDGAMPCAWAAHASLLSLPGILGLTRQDIDGVQYLPSPAPKPGHTLKVGLCWRGNPAHPNDRNRSIPAALLGPLLDAGAGADFFSLLPGDDLGGVLCPWQPGSWRDTAARVAHMDLVISADTAVAHLAGAMGIPVWILLPRVGDFRWGRVGTASLWYESAALIRQETPGDWESVISVAAEWLRLRCEASGAAVTNPQLMEMQEAALALP